MTILTIHRHNKETIQVIDEDKYVPNYETEKNKPNSLYVLVEEEQKGGLSVDGKIISG